MIGKYNVNGVTENTLFPSSTDSETNRYCKSLGFISAWLLTFFKENTSLQELYLACFHANDC